MIWDCKALTTWFNLPIYPLLEVMVIKHLIICLIKLGYLNTSLVWIESGYVDLEPFLANDLEPFLANDLCNIFVSH